MNETHLTGLEGTNPLAFLAALGVQVAFASEPEQPSLWWSDDVTPHAVVDGDFTIDRITDQAMEVFTQWKNSLALMPKRLDGTAMRKGNELKLTTDDIRIYLSQACQCQSAGALMTALVAEGSLDRQGVAKPSDLYFTAGQQKFLNMIRQILGGATRKDVLVGLEGPWEYESKLPSLKWDLCDDREYALVAVNPSDEKLTNPGPEALSILGLSRFPVFAGRDRTLTQGCSGKWTKSQYSWPLWHKPARLNAVKSLLAHAYDPAAMDRQRWFNSWGVSRVYRSQIRRSGQGGYGTFMPPQIIWQASTRQHDKSREARWSHLFDSMDRLGSEAKANGLTNSELDMLLADES